MLLWFFNQMPLKQQARCNFAAMVYSQSWSEPRWHWRDVGAKTLARRWQLLNGQRTTDKSPRRDRRSANLHQLGGRQVYEEQHLLFLHLLELFLISRSFACSSWVARISCFLTCQDCFLPHRIARCKMSNPVHAIGMENDKQEPLVQVCSVRFAFAIRSYYFSLPFRTLEPDGNSTCLSLTPHVIKK